MLGQVQMSCVPRTWLHMLPGFCHSTASQRSQLWQSCSATSGHGKPSAMLQLFRRLLTWCSAQTPSCCDTAGRQPAAEAHVQRAVRRSHHSQRQRSRSNGRRPTRLAISSFKRSSTASTRPARARQGDSDSANRTSSHHIITAATVGRLCPLHALGWQFFSRLGRGPPAPQTRDGASQHRSL